MSKLTNLLQKFLLALGALALLFLLVEIGVSVAATQSGSTPARVDQVNAGPYRFTVSLYDDPARAGFALPFAIAPQGAASGPWTYQVTSIPEGQFAGGVILINGQWAANPIRASLSPDPHVPAGVRGVAEISVQGPWHLQVVVDGPLGHQTFTVPIRAVTLPAIPTWLGWVLVGIPAIGIALFLLMQRGRAREGIAEPRSSEAQANQAPRQTRWSRSFLSFSGIILVGGMLLLVGPGAAYGTSTGASSRAGTPQPTAAGPSNLLTPPVPVTAGYEETVKEQVAAALHLTVAQITAQLQANPSEDLSGVAKQQGISEEQLYAIGLSALQTAGNQMVSSRLWTEPQADEEMQYWRQADPLALLNGVTSWFR